MNTNKNINQRILGNAQKAFLAASMTALLGMTSMTARADEFTVGSSGADVAFAQYNLTGYGVGVAVLDSGVISNQSDFNDKPYSKNWRIPFHVNFVPNTKSTIDECGHGTHVAGILAGNGCVSTGSAYYRTFYGIARRANIIDVRVLDQTGSGIVSSVISGIQWVINNKAKYNIRVINMSLGHAVGESYTTDPLCQAVEAAWKAGIVVVCAAGNQGRANASQSQGSGNEGWGAAYGSIQSPANDPYVITVGAMKSTDGNRANDEIATYSSRGPSRLDMVLKPDLVAPGNRVISTNAYNSYLCNTYSATNVVPASAYCVNQTGKTSTDYFVLSGTSMAAPVVAGAAALMLEKDPNLTADTVKARLMISADKWTDQNGNYDPCTYGAGYVNIPASLRCTAVATLPALSPSLYRDNSGNVSVNTNSVIWGTNGTNVIWGASGVSSLNVIWGNNVMWGTNVIWGNNVIWGASVWADNVIWGATSGSVDLTSTALNGEK